MEMGTQLELWNERAAIKEFCGRIPRGVAEAQARHELIIRVPFADACTMARLGWSFSKMIRFQLRQGGPPSPRDGNPSGGAMGRIVNNLGGPPLFFEVKR